MATTIVEIAKRAGVSVATISLVISDHPRISPATKKRIRALMEEMNYSPNSIARGLVNRSLRTVGVVMSLGPNQALRYPSMFEMLSGMETGLREGGYQLLLIHWDVWGQSPGKLVDLWKQKRVDGFILQSTPPLLPVLPEWHAMGLPFVLIGEPVPGYEGDWVDVDNRAAGAFAWERIRKAGYERPAFVGVEGDGIHANRLAGFREAAEAEGRNPDVYLFLEPFRARSLLAEGSSPCDAFVCGSYYFALILNDGKRGVLSFDDLPFMEYLNPPLSSVDIELFSLGQKAAEAVVRKFSDPSTKIQERSNLFKYRGRGSTGGK